MKFLSAGLFLIFTQLAFAQKSSFKNYISELKPQVKDTLFHINAADGNEVDIPTTILKGAQKGPTFTIIAGIHGMEYPTIMSLLEFRKEVDVNQLKGNLIIIPIVNVQSFYKRVPFLNPLEKLC